MILVRIFDERQRVLIRGWWFNERKTRWERGTEWYGWEAGKRKTKRLEIYNLSRKVVSVVVQVVVSGLQAHLCDFGTYLARL